MSLMPHPAPRKRRFTTKSNNFLNAFLILDTLAANEKSISPPFTEWNTEFHIKYSPKLGTPYRLIRKKIKQKRTEYFASAKNKRMVACESFNEFMFSTVLEAHPEVMSYLEQPFEINWKDSSNYHHKHIPDFLITFKDGKKIVVEVKSDSALNDIETVTRTKLMGVLVPAYASMDYLLITTSQILGHSYDNAKIIDRFENIQIDPLEFEAIRHLFARHEHSVSTDNLLINQKSPIQNLEIKINTLIRQGWITFDTQSPLVSSTELFWIGSKS